MNKDFNPNGIRVKNGNIFGLPYDEEEAEIIVIPVPWDVTASHRKGAAKGPRAILEASYQIDYFHPIVKAPWEVKMSLSKMSSDWEQINEELSEQSIEYLNYLERGHELLSEHQESILMSINEACFVLKERVKERIVSFMDQGKKVGVLGGDCSTALSLIEILSTKHKDFGVLQISAHANLRKNYQGFTYSQTSIFYNALKLPQIESLVQVGVRDVCEEEVQLINHDDRIHTFYQHHLCNAKFDGKTWKSICEDIINKLPTNVYVSFDVGGLLPSYCLNTNNPVPGGLEFDEVIYLLNLLKKSGKNIIGFDLCEVAPSEHDDWDANVGARLLWQLILMLK